MIPHLGLLQLLQPYTVLILYLGTIPVFFLSILWRPFVGIVYVVPLLPLQIIRFQMHPYPLGRSFVDIILLGVVIGIISRRQVSGLKNPLNTLLVIIALYTYLSLWIAVLFGDFSLPLWVNDERVSKWKNHVIVPIVVFFCVLAAVRTVKQMKVLVLVMCLTMMVLIRAQYGGARSHTFGAYDDANRSEAYGNGLGSNELGALEAQFCLFVVGLHAFEKRRVLRWACLGLASMTAYCVMASFSRGAYVAFVAGWAFLGAVKQRILGLALVVFVLTWQSIVPNAVRDRILMTYDKDTHELEDSSASRLTMWEDALEAVQQEPVFGTGYDTYRLLSRIGWRDCHNFYVKVLFEQGGVGLGLFLLLIWKLYHLGYRLFRTGRDPFLASLGLGLAGWMVCAFVANLFGDRWSYVHITGYMFAIAGCVARGLIMTQEQAEKPEPEVAELACA